ncbi:acyltransferase family protein [Salipaludibacillus sp. CF4.18]|uniref:acyltransferase family protein n=1 Tax=Salipaludibacillus sp. CF4.18 TaxID=3373081 RepID=UPI003EE61928
MFDITTPRIIYEAYWLRTFACTAVVLTHTVNATLDHYSASILQWEEYALIFIRFVMFFGTPTFVFLSELLLAHAYPNGVPKGFFMKRINFLLLPFTFMAFVYAVIIGDTVLESLLLFSKNLAGGYTGYFVLVILQFYVLHVLLHRFLSRWSPKIILPVALIISMIYLAFFNFSDAPSTSLGEYFWLRGYWLPFVGWLFYFALGYYCGKNFNKVKNKIQQYRLLVLSCTFIMLVIIMVSVRMDFLDVVSSKRVDYLLFTTGVIFTIIMFTSKIKKTPRIILFISKYSFTIYLTHKVYLIYLPEIPNLHPFLYFIFSTVVAFVVSIMVASILYKYKYTKYLIGKPLPVPEKSNYT